MIYHHATIVFMQTMFRMMESKIQSIFDREREDLEGNIATWRTISTRGKQVTFYPNSETLLVLFDNLPDNTAFLEFFLSIVEDKVKDDPEIKTIQGRYVTVSSLCFFTLMRLHYIDRALESLLQRTHTSNGLFQLILSLLEEGTRHINTIHLSKLCEGLRRMNLCNKLIPLRETVLTQLQKRCKNRLASKKWRYYKKYQLK